MKPNKPFLSVGPRALLVGIIVLVGLFAFLTKLNQEARDIGLISYKTYLEKVKNGQIKRVHIDGQFVEGLTNDNQRFETVVIERPSDIDLLEQQGVDFSVSQTSVNGSSWTFMIALFILFSIVGVIAWFYFRQLRGNNKGGGSGGLFNVGKSKARMFLPSAIKERFSSVAGAQEAKNDLMELVDFLKDPEKYQRLGARIPRGVLLVGQPGTGKTLLARAVAGEANCPFFSVSGADFIEVFVGVGAARVRDLFADARKKAPCIIFIDEIDAIGRQRSLSLGGGNDEREQTLNQLLTEMDGFEEHKDPVIVIAATNRPDILDSALTRPGRFDRQVEVPLPDLPSRESILKVHLAKVKVADNIDTHKIATGTMGFTGADIAKMVNESAILASKRGLENITMKVIEEVRDNMLLGKDSTSKLLSGKDRNIVAYHEAGHTLVSIMLEDRTVFLHKITIIPRASGNALGFASYLPEAEKFLTTKEEYLADIAVSMAGRAAEQFKFKSVTSGAHSDFQSATGIATYMVAQLGMSDLVGTRLFRNSDDMFSEHVRMLVDSEIKRILDEEYARAYKVISENEDKLEIIAQLLLEKETIFADEVYQAVGITPPVNSRLTE